MRISYDMQFSGNMRKLEYTGSEKKSQPPSNLFAPAREMHRFASPKGRHDMSNLNLISLSRMKHNCFYGLAESKTIF